MPDVTASLIRAAGFVVLVLFLVLPPILSPARGSQVGRLLDLRNLFASLFIGAFVGCATIGGFILLFLSLKDDRYFILPLALSLLSALVFVPLAYGIQNYLVKKCYRLEPLGLHQDLTRFQNRIQQLSSGIESRIPVEFKVSAYPNISPQTFGSAGRAVLIFPINYAQIIAALRARIGGAADCLSDFVLLHELAHIERRDFIAYTFGASYLRLLLRWWVPLFVLSFGIAAVARQKVARGTLLGGMAFLSFGLLVLLGSIYLALLTVIREREYEADRMAARQMAPEELSQVTARSVALQNLTPLEFLLGYFQHHSPLLGPALGATALKLPDSVRPAVDWLGRLISTHPTAESRCKYLTSARVPFSKDLAIENGVFMGVSITLLFFFLSFVSRFFMGFSSPPRAQFWIEVVGAAYIIFLLAFLPLKNAGATNIPFSEIHRQMWVCFLVSSLVGWGLTVALGLPVVSGYSEKILRQYLSFHISAYVFVMIGLSYCTREKTLRMPGFKDWHGPLWMLLAFFLLSIIL